MYTYYYDGGHGWLCVTKAELKRLGLLKDISPFSYKDADVVYLEADCDLARFTSAKKKIGEQVEVREVSHGDASPIRLLRSY